MKSDITDIEVQIHARTEREVCVSPSGEWGDTAWLPLAQIEVKTGEHGSATISLPEWLAQKEGLI